jgi:intron-binding protein aquarius
MALSPISKYESRQSLRNLFKNLPVTALLQIGNGLELLEALSFAQSALEPLLKLCTTDQADIESFSNTQEYQTGQKMLVEVFAHYLCRRTDSLTSINRLPLFPTEMLLWDPHIIPLENYQGDFSLALPKLNLQFLTLRDYLLRNFHLFRLESAYEIRQHLEETISQMEPHLSCAGSLTNTGTYLPVTQPYTKNITHFTHPQLSDASNLSTTWSATRFKNLSRWGVPIDRVSLVYITPPILGSKIPSQVRGEIVVNLNNVLKEFRDEWDTIRPNDVLFLISIQLPSNSINEQLNSATLRSLKHISEFPEKFGIMYVRGCNVVDVLDEEGQPVGYFDSSMTQTKHFESATQSDAYGTCRTYRVLFDSYQHYYDMNQKEDLDMYSSFNLLIRRSSAQNNFKSVLDTIRRLMNDQEHAAVPFWLHDLFLGYGDPTGSTYLSNPTWFLPQIDFHDTFLNVDHLKESFPEISTITFQQDQSTNTHDSARLLTTIVSSSHQTTPTPQSTPNASHPYTKAVLSYELSSSFSFKKQSHQNNIRFVFF